jgi:predicted KAP-like P-loop ATPase
MENMEENSDKIWTIWKKGNLNSEKIWKIKKKIVKSLENTEEK